MPDKAGSDLDVQTSLRGIAKTASLNKQHRFRDLYRLLNTEMLHLAWQGLKKNAAIADEDITVKEYDTDLDANLGRLVERLRQKRYRAKLIKRRYILKENGKKRPLGIPALEDKIVQKAAAMILTAIYEQDFLDCSYGVVVGMPVTRHPPHSPGRAVFPHPVPRLYSLPHRLIPTRTDADVSFPSVSASVSWCIQALD